MRQDDIVAILRASPSPMTVAEIHEAGGGQEVYDDSAYANLRKRLRTLSRQGIVRHADPVMGPHGQLRATWEVAE